MSGLLDVNNSSKQNTNDNISPTLAISPWIPYPDFNPSYASWTVDNIKNGTNNFSLLAYALHPKDKSKGIYLTISTNGSYELGTYDNGSWELDCYNIMVPIITNAKFTINIKGQKPTLEKTKKHLICDFYLKFLEHSWKFIKTLPKQPHQPKIIG